MKKILHVLHNNHMGKLTKQDWERKRQNEKKNLFHHTIYKEYKKDFLYADLSYLVLTEAAVRRCSSK